MINSKLLMQKYRKSVATELLTALAVNVKRIEFDKGYNTWFGLHK